MASVCVLKTGGIVHFQSWHRGRRETCAYRIPPSLKRYSTGLCRSRFINAMHALKGVEISRPRVSQVRITCASVTPGPSVSQTASTSVPVEGGDTAFLVSMLGTAQAAQDREDAASALWQRSFESSEQLEDIGKKPGRDTVTFRHTHPGVPLKPSVVRNRTSKMQLAQ